MDSEGIAPVNSTTPSVDLMVPVYNRAEYTRECLDNLIKNTSWENVRKLSVYNVCSEDGARRVIDEMLSPFKGAPYEVVDLAKMTVHDVQNIHVMKAETPFVVKIDNDTVVPPRWLETALSVQSRYPFIGLLGLYPWLGISLEGLVPDQYRYAPTPVVGGLFLSKVSVFREAPCLPKTLGGGYCGFQEWQRTFTRSVIKAWIVPGIHVILLDMIPFDPWASLGKSYIKRGWQRMCKPYSPDNKVLDWWRNNKV